MSFASLNKASTVKPGIDTTGMEYEPLSNFIGKDLHVDGFYFSDKGKYGRSVAVIADGHLINFPNWSVPQFEKLAADDDLLAAMMKGHCLITNIASKDTGKGHATTIFTFADC